MKKESGMPETPDQLAVEEDPLQGPPRRDPWQRSDSPGRAWLEHCLSMNLDADPAE
jgi:hypothetical protein